MSSSKFTRQQGPHTIPVNTRSLEPISDLVREGGETRTELLAAAIKASYFLLLLESKNRHRLYASLYNAEVEQTVRPLHILEQMRYASVSSVNTELDIGPEASKVAEKAFHAAGISRSAISHAACLIARNVLEIVTPEEDEQGQSHRGYIFAQSLIGNTWSVWPRNIRESRELGMVKPGDILQRLAVGDNWAKLGDSSVLPSMLAYYAS